MSVPQKRWPQLRKFFTFYATQNRFLWLLITLALLVLLNPLLPSSKLGRPLVSLLFTFVIVAGIYSTGNWHRLFGRYTLFWGLGTLMLEWLETLTSFQTNPSVILRFLFTIAFLSEVSANLIRQVTTDRQVTANTIYGALSGYLLIGLTGAVLATNLELIFPGSFIIGFDQSSTTLIFQHLLYFSFITLSTTGYGDITPATPLAQSLAVFLGISGQLYLAVLVAMLVGKFLNSQPRD